MKIKFPLATVLLATLLAAARADDAPASLLTVNPGFEDGLEGWSLKDSDAEAKISKAVPEAAHTGKLGLRVQQAAGQSGSWIASASIAVVPQTTYRVTFWLRTLADSHGAVYVKFIGADGKTMAETAKPPANMLQFPGGIYDWQQSQFDVKAPAGAISATIAVHAYDKAECEADFDDFSVVPVTP